MSLVKFFLGLAIELFFRSLIRPKIVYSRLAVLSLIISASVFVTPFWQNFFGHFFSSLQNQEDVSPIPALASGAIFLLLTFLFASFSTRHSVIKQEQLVDSKKISPPFLLGSSKIYVYCGSIMAISNIDVVITSENTNLNLGSINGTSVSGRIRRLAASFNSDGTVASDNIKKNIDLWISSQPHAGPYVLGTCIFSESFNASSAGIKRIIHAAAINKGDSGINIIEESANRMILIKAIDHCIENNFSSIFIPIFGLGSGRLTQDEAISKTIDPLVQKLNELTDQSFDIYIGTYKISDAAFVSAKILKNSNNYAR